MTRIGIGSWSLPWAIGFMMNPYTYPKMNALELIEYAAEHEIHLIQLYNNFDLLAIEGSKLIEIKERADLYGIQLEIGGMGINIEYLRKMLEIAITLGSQTVRTVITPLTEGEPLASPGRVVNLIEPILGEFEDASRILLIENHDNYPSTSYRDILDKCDSDSIGICFDPANNIGTLEHFRDSFKVLKDYILACHYKEFSISRIETKQGFIVEGCAPGEGLDISTELFQMIVSLNRSVDVVLEQWVPFQGSVENTLEIERIWAEQGIRILKTAKRSIF